MKRLAVVAFGLLWTLLAQSAAQQSAPPPATTNARPASVAATSVTFTGAVANELLYQFAQGMESRNARMTLGALDGTKFSGYQRFSEQVNAWFREMSGCRVYYKLKQATTEDGRGVALVDFEYEATPTAEGSSPVRRHEQMRFTFERSAKGWKIVDFSPRNLFS